MRVAITGAAGLFGQGLVQVFSAHHHHEVVPLTRADGDITDEGQMRALLTRLRPEVIIHPAAMPDIDDCEQHPELAFRVNAEATRGLVGIASDLNAGLAFISTDVVFDGKSHRPYVETDAVSPPSVYGKTKVAAEGYVRLLAKHWIFRVSVLFGPGKENFVSKALSKAKSGEPNAVANDQLGTATYTLDAAQTIMQVVESGKTGTYHVCNEGACTRYDLAKKAVELVSFDASTVIGKLMSEMQRPGPRLKYGVMEMRALREAGFTPPRRWEDALQEYVKSMH